MGDAIVFLSPAPTKRVTGVVKRLTPGKEIVIEIENDSKKNSVTEISLPRSLAAQLGVSVPSGFKEEALPLTEKEKTNKDSVEFAEKYNRGTLRWAGSFPLTPNGKSELIIPATGSFQNAKGQIDFRYEEKLGFGGSISFFRVKLGSISQ
jgi:hypothetical protein